MSVGNVSSLPGIERLIGRENWATWKFAVQTYLELEDLWCTVKPGRKADGTEEDIDPDKNRKARAKIILLLDPVNYVHVRDAATARDVWQKLETAFEDTGLTRRVGLLHKLIKTELASCDSMSDYVNRIITTAHQLDGIGFPISEEWIGTLLLAGLPEEYRPMIMALENSGTPITGDAIKTKLLQEVQSPGNDSALTAKKFSGSGGKFKQNHTTTSKGPKCRQCGKYGHIARECRGASANADGAKKKQNALSTVFSFSAITNKNGWYVDSGASAHMTGNSEFLDDIRPATGNVIAANGGNMKVTGTGTATLHPKCNSDDVLVSEVQLVPELSVNLISVNQIVKKGYSVIFANSGCKIVNSDGEVVVTANREDDLFRVDQKRDSSALTCSSAGSLSMWHKRLGHLNNDSVKKLATGLVNGIKIVGQNDKSDCVVCPMGKHCRLPFGKTGSRASSLLELVHTDICGPMEVTSIGKSRYYLAFVDDFSRKMWVYFLKTKTETEVLSVFKVFHAMAERLSGQKLKTLRSDNGKEFVNAGFENYLKKNGIQHQKSNAYTPEQNGMAERANRSIVERARCMLHQAGLEKSFWAEAVNTSVYLINRSPTRGHDSTPEEIWTGKKPDLSNIRIFGTRTMVQIPKQRRRKWDPKSHECILVGFDELTKGYKLYDPKSRKVFVSREVTFIDEGAPKIASREQGTVVLLDFDEEVSLGPTAKVGDRQEEVNEETDDEEFFSDATETFRGDISDDEVFRGFESDAVTSVLPPRKSSKPPQSQVLRRSGREHVLPRKYNDFQVPKKGLPRSNSLQQTGPNAIDHDGENLADPVAESKVNFGEVAASSFAGQKEIEDDPVSHQEALSRGDAECWTKAMRQEYQALIRNNTWTLTELPPGRKAIKCKWVFKTKHDANGNIDRHKARLVIKGYSQRRGVDYDETYSPVVRHSSLRYLFALAAKHDLSVEQMDATTAFLQSELKEEIFMEQPPCFQDADRTKVCRLNKALYGLKQSSRTWNCKLDTALKKLGLKPSKYDTCLYYRLNGREMLFVAVYVDDVVLFSNDDNLKNEVKSKLKSMFQMKDLGTASCCLGIRITRTDSTISLDQEPYIESLLARFNMQNCKAVSTPMNTSERLAKDMSPKTTEEIDRMKNVPYQEAVGALMYLAQCTRPDILFAVNHLSRFNTCAGEKHWEAVKHLLRYVRGSSKMKLCYTKSSESELVGYTDANWAADLDDRKSTSGYLFTFQGGAVSWCCKRQPTVALSSCEAEYMALSASVQEAAWWRGLISEFGKTRPLPLRCDNQSAICVAKNGGYTPRTKHIDIRHHYIREALEQNVVTLSYVSTDEQLADGLTKPLERIKLERNRTAMGITRTA